MNNYSPDWNSPRPVGARRSAFRCVGTSPRVGVFTRSWGKVLEWVTASAALTTIRRWRCQKGRCDQMSCAREQRTAPPVEGAL